MDEHGNDNSTMDSSSTVSGTLRVPDELPPMGKGELDKWRLERQGKINLPPTRFVIPNMIISVGRQVDEKITMRHVSDKVVYNIVFMEHEHRSYPTQSAPDDLKTSSVKWLKSFRTQLIQQMTKIAKRNFLLASKDKEWKDLGVNASGFNDLCKLTIEETGERVRNC